MKLIGNVLVAFSLNINIYDPVVVLNRTALAFNFKSQNNIFN